MTDQQRRQLINALSKQLHAQRWVRHYRDPDPTPPYELIGAGQPPVTPHPKLEQVASYLFALTSAHAACLSNVAYNEVLRGLPERERWALLIFEASDKYRAPYHTHDETGRLAAHRADDAYVRLALTALLDAADVRELTARNLAELIEHTINAHIKRS